MRLPTTRWLIQYNEYYIDGDRTFTRPIDAIRHYAGEVLPERGFKQIDECAQKLNVERADICAAIWRAARRRGVKLVKVNMTEAK